MKDEHRDDANFYVHQLRAAGPAHVICVCFCLRFTGREQRQSVMTHRVQVQRKHRTHTHTQTVACLPFRSPIDCHQAKGLASNVPLSRKEPKACADFMCRCCCFLLWFWFCRISQIIFFTERSKRGQSGAPPFGAFHICNMFFRADSAGDGGLTAMMIIMMAILVMTSLVPVFD